MRYVVFGVVVVLGMLAGIGCRTADEQAAVQESVAVNQLSVISDKEWVLLGMTIEGARYPLSGRMPTLRFGQNGKVGGFASVNRYFGSVQVGGRGRLQWSEGFGATRMAGPPEAMQQETAYLQALVKTEFMEIDGETLVIFAEDRQTVLTFSQSAD